MTERTGWRIVLTRASDLRVGDVIRLTDHPIWYCEWGELHDVDVVNEIFADTRVVVGAGSSTAWLSPLALVERQEQL